SRVASTQQQEPGYGGKRIAAGDSGLQPGAGGDVPGGKARQPQPTPTQFFVCTNRGGSRPAGIRPCRHRSRIPTAIGSYVALRRSGQATESFPTPSLSP